MDRGKLGFVIEPYKCKNQGCKIQHLWLMITDVNGWVTEEYWIHLNPN